MLNEKALDSIAKISYWGRLTGWFLVIGGGLSALTGLFAFVVGAIPGVLELIIGVFLIKAANKAGDYKLEQTDQNFGEFVSNLAVYFKIQGILLLIGIAIFLIGAIFWGTVIINIIHHSGSSY